MEMCDVLAKPDLGKIAGLQLLEISAVCERSVSSHSLCEYSFEVATW
jgi:hypothetical protein